MKNDFFLSDADFWKRFIKNVTVQDKSKVRE